MKKPQMQVLAKGFPCSRVQAGSNRVLSILEQESQQPVFCTSSQMFQDLLSEVKLPDAEVLTGISFVIHNFEIHPFSPLVEVKTTSVAGPRPLLVERPKPVQKKGSCPLVWSLQSESGGEDKTINRKLLLNQSEETKNKTKLLVLDMGQTVPMMIRKIQMFQMMTMNLISALRTTVRTALAASTMTISVQMAQVQVQTVRQILLLLFLLSSLFCQQRLPKRLQWWTKSLMLTVARWKTQDKCFVHGVWSLKLLPAQQLFQKVRSATQVWAFLVFLFKRQANLPDAVTVLSRSRRATFEYHMHGAIKSFIAICMVDAHCQIWSKRVPACSRLWNSFSASWPVKICLKRCVERLRKWTTNSLQKSLDWAEPTDKKAFEFPCSTPIINN